MAAAIAIQLMEQEHSVIFQTADDLFQSIKATFDENGRNESERDENGWHKIRWSEIVFRS